jgi:predicted NUDIX family NTP pyrophosphohydrolase
MPRQSAGILCHRRRSGKLEVLLVHPGGPYWKNKDEGAWSIPKGEFGDSDDPLEAAKREVTEEIGASLAGPFEALGSVRQPGGKVVHAWAVETDLDTAQVTSNTFVMEWPPKSGKTQAFPEVDRAEWFPMAEAERKILKGQLPLLQRLANRQST